MPVITRKKINIRILLNGKFKPLFLKKKIEGIDKEYHLGLLRNTIIEMFIRLMYPYNMCGIYNTDFKLINPSKKGVVVTVKLDMFLEDENELKNIRKYNLHPEFIKSLSIIQ